MAEFHLALKMIGRATGAQIIAKAAYRHATAMRDENTGVLHDYSSKPPAVEVGVMIPDEAEEWLAREVSGQASVAEESCALWSAVDRDTKPFNRTVDGEKFDVAQIARELEVSLPVELSEDQQKELITGFVQCQIVGRHNVAADIVIHRYGRVLTLNNDFDARKIAEHEAMGWRRVEVDSLDDAYKLEGPHIAVLRDDSKQRAYMYQPHAHVLTTVRSIGADGLGNVNRDYGSRVNTLELREAWSNHQNLALEHADRHERVDHRNFVERGIAPDVTLNTGAVKLGPQAIAAERAGEHHPRLERRDARLAELSDERIIASAIYNLTQSQEYFTPADLVKKLRPLTNNFGHAQQLSGRAMADDRIIGLETDTGMVFTTTEAIKQTMAFERASERLNEDTKVRFKKQHIISGIKRFHENKSFRLSDEQRDLVETIARGGGLSLLEAPAGAGKTTVMEAVKMIAEEADYRVEGVTIAGKAAEGLAEVGINARTIDSFLMRLDTAEKARTAITTENLDPMRDQLIKSATWAIQQINAQNRERSAHRTNGAQSEDTVRRLNFYRRVVSDLEAGRISERTEKWCLKALENAVSRNSLDNKSMLIIDEAGMVDTAKMSRLLEHAAEVGARVVAIGDTTQIAAIDRGSPFERLVDRYSALAMSEVRRQRDPVMKAASIAFHERRWQDGLATYERLGNAHYNNSIVGQPIDDRISQEIYDRTARLAETLSQARTLYAMSKDNNRSVEEQKVSGERAAELYKIVRADAQVARDHIRSFAPALDAAGLTARDIAYLSQPRGTDNAFIKTTDADRAAWAQVHNFEGQGSELRDLFDFQRTAKQRIVDDYMTAIDRAGHDKSLSALIMAYTNKDVTDLNAMVRAGLKDRDMLGEDHRISTTAGAKAMAIGDTITFRRNERALAEGVSVKNGTIGTITDITDGVLTVQNGEQVATFATDITAAKTTGLKLYQDIDHGYAITVHRAQGVTVDHAFYLHRAGSDANLLHVASTRHRDSYAVYTSSRDGGSAEIVRENTKDYRAEPSLAELLEARDRTVSERLTRSVMNHIRTAGIEFVGTIRSAVHSLVDAPKLEREYADLDRRYAELKQTITRTASFDRLSKLDALNERRSKLAIELLKPHRRDRLSVSITDKLLEHARDFAREAQSQSKGFSLSR